MRKADVPPDWNIDKPFPGAPTLAVEVMSPDDRIEAVLTRVRRYLEAGSAQVWVVFPIDKELHVYERTAPDVVRIYREADTLDGGDLLPGFSLHLREVFTVPTLR